MFCNSFKKNKLKKFADKMACGLFFVFFMSIMFASVANGQNIEELKKKIEERNSTIKQLEGEINKYQKEVENTGKQAKTLQNTVKSLDLTEKKIGQDIKVTENKISATNFTIEKIDLEIKEKEEAIERSLSSLGEIMRGVNESDDLSFLEIILINKNMSDFWNDMQTIETLQKSVKENMGVIKKLKEELEAKRNDHGKQKNNLVNYKEDLDDKKKIVAVSKSEKNNLLQSTKEKESNYKKVLEQKIALKSAFEKELLQFESELKIAIDPKSYSQAKKGALSWPVDVVKITQYFGNTAFAQSGAYNGSGHNGIDLGVAVGTPIKSAASGKVVGSGDTDLVCPGASYGKWILVEHLNGLSTLYAHLSLIKATAGQSVMSGDLIGYSGNTGYSTGPHLHFTTYATQGVKILSKKSAVCGGTYVMPIADLKAYLNPMTYL